jgi:protocatechuate 3,4-dioxygenase alpha subunit
MSQPASLGQTPSQTVGPFFAYGLVPAQYGYAFNSLFGPVLAEARTPGTPIELRGRVLDGQGEAVGDAMVEILHADAQGRYPASPAEVATTGFRGFGRAGTGTLPGHEFAFRTIKPGVTADGQAPHINLILTMRGLLNHAFTRLCFDDEPAANAQDPVLVTVPEARRHTLIARRDNTAGGLVYRFDIRMQGEAETVFFDL